MPWPCPTNKVSHLTETSASVEMNRMCLHLGPGRKITKDHATRLEVFKCEKCTFWHVGKRPVHAMNNPAWKGWRKAL